MEFYKKKSGFTLVEVLVAMAIFVSFVGVLINGYVGIVRAQREANDYRIMYVEARKVFETLTDKFRDSVVDYASYSSVPVLQGNESLNFVSKSGEKFTISHVNNELRLIGDESETLNSEVLKVTDFKMYVSPAVDPYSQKYVDYASVQFQPRVTFYAEFERDLASGQVFTMNLQTTVSSRLYNSPYAN